MPSDNEIMLGWPLEEFCKLFNLKMPTLKEREDEDVWEAFERAVANLIAKDKLLLAQANALMKSKIAKNLRKPTEPPWNEGDYIEGDTSKGTRTFASLGIEIIGDESEIGDEYPCDFLVGIAISGRYVPTYLDWRDPCGTMNNISFEAMQPEILVIRKEIERLEPRFKTAKTHVKLRWY